MTLRNRVATGLAALITGGLWLTTSAQQLELARGSRQILSDLTAPAIDRGLRENDPPRAARTSNPLAVREFVPGSVIVKFRAGTPTTAQRTMLALVEASAAPAPTYADFDIVTIDRGADAEAVARQLSAQPDVEYAQARYRVHPSFVPNDPLYSRQWNYPAIDMERAWDLNRGAGPEIVVAVLDTGVAYRNVVLRFNADPFQLSPGGPIFPALGPVELPFRAAPELGGEDRFVAPRDFIWNDTVPVDLDGHGTHVTGTIAQLTNNGVGVAGMAFNVRIMPVKVTGGLWDDIFASPVVGTDDTVARGIRYAVDNGAKVLNISLGRATAAPAPAVQAAVAYAVSRGAFVVVAAGNEFLQGNPVERFAEFAPQIEGMVAVGAIGPDRRRAFYSSTGPYIELAAPGGNADVGGTPGAILQQTYDLDFVETYLNGPSRYFAPQFDRFAYTFFQGTSMAAPHVAGFAALLMQQGITSPAAVEAAMERYATDLGAAGRDNEYGHGLINPRASLRGLGLAR